MDALTHYIEALREVLNASRTQPYTTPLRNLQEAAQSVLTAWDADMPILTTLIRSGREGWRTPTGTFRTFRKVERDDMTLLDPSDPDYYYTPNVPWVMYFLEGGFALHGAVWDDMWGTPTSHGCINIPVDIAAFLYEWADLGTLVWIHGHTDG